jgi:NhaA family Na+:H+ antiporter
MRRLTLAYLRTESGAGLVLPVAAVAAIGLATSGYAAHDRAFLTAPVAVQLYHFTETLSVAGWARAGLMPVFFLVLGMGLKFELLRGELSNPRRLALPALAALGGLLVPALIYLAVGFAWGDGLTPGWAIGSATDGAAALAALTLADSRLAHPLRVLLIAVAMADNLFVVIVGAILHAGALDRPMLIGAGISLAALVLLSRWRRAPFVFYALGFAVVWAFTLKSGLDPTLAGVASAMTVPVGARRAGQESVLKFFLESLHPYVAFVVLPIFIFTAAGFSLHHFHLRDLVAPAPMGVMLALAVGKPLGVFGACAIAIGVKAARRPTGVTWRELAGVACLCGVGFTVSYFVAGMGSADAPAPMRAAILIGSALAATAGGWLLGRAKPRPAL